MVVEIFIRDLRIISTINRREHWTVRAKRNREQRKLAWGTMAECRVPQPDAAIITLERRYPNHLKPMDSDNLAISFKAVRDGIADYLGIDDGSARLLWRYTQTPAVRWGVNVTIETGE